MALFLNDAFHDYNGSMDYLFIIEDWQILAPPGPERPGVRQSHAATYFKMSKLGVESKFLFIVGGKPNNDSWICDLLSVKWKRVSVSRECAVMHAQPHNAHLPWD